MLKEQLRLTAIYNRTKNELIKYLVFSLRCTQKEAIKITNEQMGAISQESEDRIDHKIEVSGKRLAELTNEKFNVVVRRLDKLTTTEEGDTVQFKCAFEQQGTFQQMASVISELVNKRNKEFKIPAMDTPSKPKFDLSQYKASTPIEYNKLLALGLSPISSH
ncbi:ATPeV1D [Mytilus coruscus]|uniref:ATPeV1D n=1 Tax=Mytilus coruscus TaxID=42192 RepID=A0A6J8DE68_MYTCO|nr:ATPeV1D [Mytilus coruscus]